VTTREQAPRDWDADTYDRISDPQVEMARSVLARLELRGDETVLDAGCGSGRVTKLLLERLPHGRVVAVDAAPSMVERARAELPSDRVTVVHADLAELVVDEHADLVFSTAVFHWVPDHERLFARLHAALRPGGRLVAQCGGKGNVERFLAAAREAGQREPFAEHLGGWSGPWHFASVEDTERRLERTGFAALEVWTEPHPVVPRYTEEYLRTVCLRNHLEQLPAELRGRYVTAVVERCGQPLELDYVRLNIDARRPA
jgi:trans-aconitate 2-methyltransferase